MTGTPRSERLHIVLFGPCNAGKSSLLNALTEKDLAIVSAEAGTTTDPVSKSMELGELGAVTLVDTAGLDDVSPLGKHRCVKTRQNLERADLAILVSPAHRPPVEAERDLVREVMAKGVPLVVARSFCLETPLAAKTDWLDSLKTFALQTRQPLVLDVDSQHGQGIAELRRHLCGLRQSLAASVEPGPLAGLVRAGDTVVLVMPIDSAAPRGRLILPEAQTLRDALDLGCIAIAVQPDQLPAALRSLPKAPDLVVTDSQAFDQVAALLPANQRLTSFSILFARKKGGLQRFQAGLRYLDELASQTAGILPPLRLLVVEACAHNRSHEDIATIKIPALLRRKLGREVELTLSRQFGSDVPAKAFDLALLCGGCMATARDQALLQDRLDAQAVPYVNFGLALAWLHGQYPRVLS